MSRNRDLNILGRHDRLLFARTAEGVLVCAVIETDWHWLDAPHEGQATPGSPEWREDNQYMHDWVSGRSKDYDWRACDTPWSPESDEAFVNQSAAHYLPPRKERSVRRLLWPRRQSAPARRICRAAHVLAELTLVVGQILYQVARFRLPR
ncbi:MAG TPA: hypothetical protein VLW50_25755 [Streptosporangiaceae bacterium]|nr:hypothetical protein [Streptosporangiaceae bacterium]